MKFRLKIIIYLRFQYVQQLSGYIVLFLCRIDVSCGHIVVATIYKDKMCQCKSNIKQGVFSTTECNFKTAQYFFKPTQYLDEMKQWLEETSRFISHKVKLFLFFVSNLCTFIMFRTFMPLKSLYKILIISKTESESLLSVRLVRFFFLKNTNV